METLLFTLLFAAVVGLYLLAGAWASANRRTVRVEARVDERSTSDSVLHLDDHR